jgi:hypothetical protein
MSGPTGTTKAVSPQAGPPRRPKPRYTVHRGAPPPDELQRVLNELYECPDCNSEVRWDLRVGIGHDPTCITMRRP